MLDLNRLLLFIAALSPLVILVRTARRAPLNRGWQLAAGAILLITTLAWMVNPRSAGFVGGGAWLAFLFLPAVGLRKATELATEERYLFARRILMLLQWLHPARAVRDEIIFLRGMEAAQDGHADRALQLLESLRDAESRAGLQAVAQSFRLRGDWPGLLVWCRSNLPLVALGREPALFPLYLRALGETGSVEELILQMASRGPALLASPQHQGTFDLSALAMLAFAGRSESLARLLKTRFRRLRADDRDFWLGTSQLAAGEIEAGRARLESLRLTTKDALIRASIEERLRQDLRASLSPASEATVRRFEKNLARRRNSMLALQPGLPTVGVATFIALNLAMFAFELSLGGSTNSFTLHQLGALEPFAVFARGEYWRLLAALFLHYGALHLLVNLYALYVLGPPLEGFIGTTRFAVCYLASGLGSSGGVVALWYLGWTEANLLVGASGAVMGVVGAWAGLLLRHRHLPMARRRLFTIGLIALIQTAFDFYTPQVSMAAHLCGLLTGLLLGWVLAPRREAERE